MFASNITFFRIFQNLQISVKFCKKFCKILQNFCGFLKILQNFAKFAKKCQNFCNFFQFFSRNFQNLLARRWFSCRFWKMLKNAALDAKIGFDPAENEPRKEWCVVAGRRRSAARSWKRGTARGSWGSRAPPHSRERRGRSSCTQRELSAVPQSRQILAKFS